MHAKQLSEHADALARSEENGDLLWKQVNANTRTAQKALELVRIEQQKKSIGELNEERFEEIGQK